YGKENLDKALHLYADRFRFRHPRPRDLYDVLGEVLGKEARKQAVLMFEKNGWIDLSVHSVETRSEGARLKSSIQVKRNGYLDLPVSLTASFSDQTERVFPFPMSAREHTFEIEHEASLVYAEI